MSEPFILRSGKNLHRAKLQMGNHVLDGIHFEQVVLPYAACDAPSFERRLEPVSKWLLGGRSGTCPDRVASRAANALEGLG